MLDEIHLRRILARYFEYYNATRERPILQYCTGADGVLGKDTPNSPARAWQLVVS